jgi:hypothetical protein
MRRPGELRYPGEWDLEAIRKYTADNPLKWVDCGCGNEAVRHVGYIFSWDFLNGQDGIKFASSAGQKQKTPLSLAERGVFNVSLYFTVSGNSTPSFASVRKSPILPGRCR